MVGRDRRLERREDVDLALRLILKIVPLRSPTYRLPSSSKRQTGCHAHAFHEQADSCRRGRLIDDAFVTARDIEHALAVECEPGRRSSDR